jgi:hypothetical protein
MYAAAAAALKIADVMYTQDTCCSHNKSISKLSVIYANKDAWASTTLRVGPYTMQQGLLYHFGPTQSLRD